MNYRGRQVKLMWERDIATKMKAWLAKEQTYKQDIINLQNSTDAKIIEGLEKDLQKKQTLLNDTINLLGATEIKSLTDLENLLEGQTLKELLTDRETKISNGNAEITKLTEQLAETTAKLDLCFDENETQEKELQAHEQRASELNHNLSLKAAKISNLETNLLNLAKQKLTSKKEAQKLVSQIEEKWKEKQADWENQSQRQQDHFAQSLAQTKAEHSEELKQKQTKITELTQWSEGQHNRILELENQASVLELKLETTYRERDQREQDWVREKEEIDHAHQTNLNEQKTFYQQQLEAKDNQFLTNEQTITQLTQQTTAQQQNITTLTQQNQRSAETIRTHTNRITQLEGYLQTSQADQQSKQTQINTLNRDKLDLQDRITGLIQSRKKDLEEWTQVQTDQQTVINDQQKQLQTYQTKITELERVAQLTSTEQNQTNARQRTVLEQLLTNREEELEQLEGEEE